MNLWQSTNEREERESRTTPQRFPFFSNRGINSFYPLLCAHVPKRKGNADKKSEQSKTKVKALKL